MSSLAYHKLIKRDREAFSLMKPTAWRTPLWWRLSWREKCEPKDKGANGWKKKIAVLCYCTSPTMSALKDNLLIGCWSQKAERTPMWLCGRQVIILPAGQVERHGAQGNTFLPDEPWHQLETNCRGSPLRNFVYLHLLSAIANTLIHHNNNSLSSSICSSHIQKTKKEKKKGRAGTTKTTIYSNTSHVCVVAFSSTTTMWIHILFYSSKSSDIFPRRWPWRTTTITNYLLFILHIIIIIINNIIIFSLQKKWSWKNTMIYIAALIITRCRSTLIMDSMHAAIILYHTYSQQMIQHVYAYNYYDVCASHFIIVGIHIMLYIIISSLFVGSMCVPLTSPLRREA